MNAHQASGNAAIGNRPKTALNSFDLGSVLRRRRRKKENRADYQFFLFKSSFCAASVEQWPTTECR